MRRVAVAAALAGVAVLSVLGLPAAEAVSPALDPDFGVDGRTVLGGPGVSQVHDLAVGPDGSVVVVGQVLDGGVVHAVVARLTADGRPDESFGQRRLVGVAGVDEKAHAVALLPDGRILVAGETAAGSDAAVWRLLPDGSPDQTFSDDGFATVPDAGGKERADAVAAAPDGSVVVGGFTSNLSRALVARFTSSGQPDAGFDGDGWRLLGGTNYYHDIRAVTVQPDGKVLATGANGGTAGAPVYRLRTDGSDDPGFGGSGRVDVPGTVFDGRDLLLQPDGRVVVLAQVHVSDEVGDAPVLARLDAAGGLDPTFGWGAGSVLGVAGFSSGEELVARRSGFVVAVATVGRGPVVLATDADGRAEDAFGQVAPGGVRVTGLGVQPEGGFVLGVNTTTGAEVDRLLGDRQPGGRGPTAVPTCHGRPATVVGTPGKDRIRGTAKADVIVALGGHDVVSALGGDDVVCAGAGNDRVLGGGGKDRVYGEAGKDRLVGGAGKDRLVGGPGRDRTTP